MLLALLIGCAGYRTYPLLQLDDGLPGRPLEPSGVAMMADHRLVIVAEGDATRLYTPTPDVPLGTGGVLELFPLQDGRRDCEAPDAPRACERRRFRGQVRLHPEPVRWLPRERGVTVPFDVQDLAAYEGERVLGVTAFSTVGRRSGFRKDYQARSRRQTERLFALERSPDGWTEVALPEIDRLRDSLSDWGRSNCREDLLVEGLAYDAGGSTVYIGLSRCNGPAARVLSYDVGAARLGLAASLELAADGIAGRALGPAEGLSGLSFAAGRLWALTSWDSYGSEVEPAFGGQLHEVRDGQLVPVDLPGRFLDRPSALAVLADDDSTAFSDLDAVVLFDNDQDAGNHNRPNATLLRARTPAPKEQRFAQLLSIDAAPAAPSLGMNGLDLRWYARDHRLSQLAVLLDRDKQGEPGAWTRAVGGRWQIQVGASMGQWSAALGLGPVMGYNKQAVAFTDFSGTSLSFTGYRARMSVIPRDRERQNPSVATLLDRERSAYRVVAPIPQAPEGAGLVLQGVEIDTSSRAEEGVCVAAMDLGVEWADSKHDAVALQGTLIGGLCNDFDNRGPAYSHGRTTTPDGGVEVILHFAVVTGAQATEWAAGVADQRLPAPQGKDAVAATDDATARAHLHCVRIDAEGPHVLPRQPDAPPADWLSLRGDMVGRPDGPSVLRGFTLALDPVGFSPGARALSEAEALARNNYIYRYLVRTFRTENGLFLEGGMSHGIHKAGLMRDNALPSAVAVAVRGTSFPGVAGAHEWDIVTDDRQADPNLLPEDGFIRRAIGQPRTGAPKCSTSW